jgi:hypothetical protein
MSRISAGGNLSIDIQPTSWRLLANGADAERALVEAAMSEPLRYVPSFGATRRLPDTGILPTKYIQRVVLGWSHDDEAWHLGFLLEPDLAAPRGSRWCEIAYWPDPDGTMFLTAAREAGESLARAMARPFYLVPMQQGARTAPAAPAPMPPLPHQLEAWAINRNQAGQIEITTPPQSGTTRVRRGLWYGLLSIIYFALSGLTLSSGIALPRPEFLPYIGLAAAVILLIAAVRALITRGGGVERIVVHPEAKVIRGIRDRKDVWRYEADELRAVYVTQQVEKPRRNGRQNIAYGELNLQLADGSFQHILQQGAIEIESADENEGKPAEDAQPLTNRDARTGLQALALHVAQMLGVPCVYDQRVK